MKAMNNTLNNTLNLQPAVNATVPLSGAANAGTGASGAFAQLLGSLVTTAGTPMANEGGGALTAIPVAVSEGDASVTNSASPTEQPQAAVVMLQPDAALIAALLGQMQTPYAMPVAAAPTVAVPDAPAPAATTAAAQTNAVNGVPVVADFPLEYATTEATAAAASTTPTPAPSTASEPQQPATRTSEATPALSGTRLEVQTQPSSSEAALVAAVARGEPTTSATAMVLPKALSASPPPSPVPAATLAAVPMSNPPMAMPNTTPLSASDEPGTSEERPHPSLASVMRDDNPAPSTRARALDELRHGLPVQSAEYAQESAGTASAVATESTNSLAAAHAAARSPFPASGQRDDRLIDATAIPAAMPAAAAAHGDLPATSLNIAPRFASPEWQPAFTQNVKMLVNDGLSSATLQLNPGEFGPIEVRIVISDQRADISFMVDHPDANAAIQSSLSELRDQLARSGIQLGQTSVGAHPQHPQQSGDTPRHQTQAAPAPEHAPANPTPAPTRGNSGGRVDIYA